MTLEVWPADQGTPSEDAEASLAKSSNLVNVCMAAATVYYTDIWYRAVMSLKLTYTRNCSKLRLA